MLSAHGYYLLHHDATTLTNDVSVPELQKWLTPPAHLQKRAEAQNASSRGKLSSQLAAQRSQTHAQALQDASRAERAARDTDLATQARRWD
jgi:hypothetical protein